MYRLLPIVLFAIGLAVTTENIYDNSYALIIGINEYDNVMNLNYAVDDAVSLVGLLVEGFGFKLENTMVLLKKDARIIIYFTGHAETMMLASGGDMGYLFPADGNLDILYQSSIPLESIYDIAFMSYAKHILFLFDAAIGGLNLNTRDLKMEFTPEYLMKITKEKSKRIISAGGRGDYIIEKAEWGHSSFTRNLLSS